MHLHNPALTRLEFVEMLAARFGLSQRARASKTDLLLELEQLLRSDATRRRRRFSLWTKPRAFRWSCWKRSAC